MANKNVKRNERVGKPTLLDDELAKKLLSAISLGMNYKESCAYASVSYDAFNEWMHRDEPLYAEFRQSVARAKASTKVSFLATFANAAQKKTDWRAAESWLSWNDRTDRNYQSDDVDKFFSIPAEYIAPDFLEMYRILIDGGRDFREFSLEGGRGGAKSSFIALAIVWMIVNHPDTHALIIRRVYGTVKDSVYARIVWAIEILGLSDKFKLIQSPFEITYKPTNQKIYFRGADDASKLKSITPRFGHIGILWFEEFDQFDGDGQVRNIVQSAIRGGDTAYQFETWNTPKNRSHWVNKYVSVPRANRYHLKTTYKSVPPEWLGKAFYDNAEFLKSINPSAYEHEYMGIANSDGGSVFSNLEIREITDDEISNFDRVYHGLDFGYADPAHYSQSYFDKARLTLYIFGEVRKHKTRNEDFYKLMLEYGYKPDDLLVADSAEPKSIMDYRAYGATVRGATKGRDSVKYRMRWMQSLVKIVIDNKRAPFTAQEFLEYESMADKDGTIIEDYPDKNNHAIDSVGYGTNPLWIIGGQ